MSGPYAVVKRAMDIGGALIGLVVLSPVIALSAGAVRVFMGSPVIFRQERGGRCGSKFTICKFRTMSDETDADGKALRDDERTTRVGRFMRRFSLDELPQLYNVLKGDMSLVGPRPLVARYLPRYSARQARRHEVRPGLTGWAQVNGRNAQTWEERFELDVWYVGNVSFLLDLKILVLTVWRVFAGSGISAGEKGTKEEFMGEEGVETGMRSKREDLCNNK